MHTIRTNLHTGKRIAEAGLCQQVDASFNFVQLLLRLCQVGRAVRVLHLEQCVTEALHDRHRVCLQLALCVGRTSFFKYLEHRNACVGLARNNLELHRQWEARTAGSRFSGKKVEEQADITCL